MTSLDDPPGTADLIWAEGSIYILGFFRGLVSWHTLLRDGGQLVASELTWLIDPPPEEARAYWREEYPTMTTIEGNIAGATEVGYEVYDHFVLPSAGWWEEYLTPLARRMDELRPAARTDPALHRVLEEAAAEIAICHRHGDTFGYVYYLMQRVD
jgi:serine/threonine-protein kinase HipA